MLKVSPAGGVGDGRGGGGEGRRRRWLGRREAWIVGWRGGVWAEQQFPFQLGDFFLSLMDLSEVQARCSQLLQPVQRTDICLRSLMFSLQVVQV